MRKGNVTKYIQKLKENNLAALVVGQNNGLGLKEVFHPAFDRTVRPAKRQQIAEFYGKFGENHEFFSDNYKHLLILLKQNDLTYSNSENPEERISLCKMGITTWHNFVKEEAKNLSEEDSKIAPASYKLLREVFERQKERNKNYLPAEEILGFHYEYAKNKEFDFPLDPKSLAVILHPHWGYLCKFTKKNFTFDEIIEFYNYEFLSSFYRKSGRDILANRVTALNLWNVLDKDKKGFLEYKVFVQLLEAAAFNIDKIKKIDNFQTEFNSSLNNLPNEMLANKQNLFRFRLFEYLYMERSAIY